MGSGGGVAPATSAQNTWSRTIPAPASTVRSNHVARYAGVRRFVETPGVHETRHEAALGDASAGSAQTINTQLATIARHTAPPRRISEREPSSGPGGRTAAAHDDDRESTGEREGENHGEHPAHARPGVTGGSEIARRGGSGSRRGGRGGGCLAVGTLLVELANGARRDPRLSGSGDRSACRSGSRSAERFPDPDPPVGRFPPTPGMLSWYWSIPELPGGTS